MVKRIPDAFIFMKVGNHARESFEDIIERKSRELRDTGSIFWGYGGGTLHPTQHVQPFARMHIKQHGSIYLVMESIDSGADQEYAQATEVSVDGMSWEPIPEGPWQ